MINEHYNSHQINHKEHRALSTKDSKTQLFVHFVKLIVLFVVKKNTTMKKYLFLVLLALFSHSPFCFAQTESKPDNDLLYFYNAELEKLDQEISSEEAEYSKNKSAALLASISNKKLKREVLGVFAGKLIKRRNISLGAYGGFSRVKTKIVDKQRELEDKYDLKINYIIDNETEKAVSGLGTKVLKAVTKNESSSNNRRVDITLHFYQEAMTLGFKTSLTQVLQTELAAQPAFEEKTFQISAGLSSEDYLTTKFNEDLEEYLKSLSVILNPSNIAELEKLKNSDNTFSFISPSGIPFTLSATNLKSVRFYFNDRSAGTADPLSFRADGALQGYTIDDNYYGACYQSGNVTNFLGYASYSSNSNSCIGLTQVDQLSKVCSQKDCVIVATACMEEGTLKFKIKKIPLLNKAKWPTANHSATGPFVTPCPVDFSVYGKTAELTDYTFTQPYNKEAREFLEKNNTCESRYVPYVATVANIVNTLPTINKDCFSLSWFITNYALFNCAACTTAHFNAYQAKVDALVARINALSTSYYNQSTNNLILATNDKSDLYELIKEYNACDFAVLTNAQRFHILKLFLASALTDDYERITLSLFNGLGSNSTTIISFLNGLIDPQNNVDGKSLLTLLYDRFDDGLGDNYAQFNKTLTKIIGSNEAVLTNYFPTTNDEFKALFYYDDSYLFTTAPLGTHKYDVSMSNNGHISVVKSYVDDYETSLNVYPGGETYATNTAHWASENLGSMNPFTVVTVINRSSISSIESATAGEPILMVPAAFLRFAEDKKFNYNTIRLSALAVDALSIATGPGLVIKAYKAGRIALALYEGAQVVGALANISTNALPATSETKKWIDEFNLVVAAWGGARLTINVSSKAYNSSYFNLAKTSLFNGISEEKIQYLISRYNSIKSNLTSHLNSANASAQVDKIVEYLKKLVKASQNIDGITNIFKDGYTKEMILAIVHGQRPLPAIYLKAEYIINHLLKFDGEVSCLSFENSINTYGQIGRNDGLFIISKKEMDDLLQRTGNNVAMIEKELGIPEGTWSNRINDPLKPDKLVRIDVKNSKNHNLRMASGNEDGANSLWLPGGKTPEGLSEAVIDPISASQTSLYTKSIIAQ